MSSSPVHNFIEDSSRILQQLVLGLFYVSLLLSGLLGNLSQYLIWAIWTYSSITELGQFYIALRLRRPTYITITNFLLPLNFNCN